MNPFRAHLEKKDEVIARQRALEKSVKKGLVVDQLLLPELVLSIEYPGTRHDN